MYKTIGISKQAVHKMLNLRNKQHDEREQLKHLIENVREDHPSIGVRDIYYKIKPEFMGRDKFETFCRFSNYMIKYKPKYCKTTDSCGVKRFPNLIENKQINRLNQVWQSDITYFEVGGRFYFLTFIMDSYSRRILGYSVSKRLLTDHTTLPAIKMAIKTRNGFSLKGLILHSDGGGQYYADEFLKVTSHFKIKNSMCKNAWENGKAERLNGIIKNNYLKYRNINSFEKLCKEVDRAVELYNHDKPHIKLNRKSPIQFENYLLPLNRQETAKMKKSFYANQTKTLLLEGIEPSEKQGKKTAQNLNVFNANFIEN